MKHKRVDAIWRITYFSVSFKDREKRLMGTSLEMSSGKLKIGALILTNSIRSEKV